MMRVNMRCMRTTLVHSSSVSRAKGNTPVSMTYRLTPQDLFNLKNTIEILHTACHSVKEKLLPE